MAKRRNKGRGQPAQAAKEPGAVAEGGEAAATPSRVRTGAFCRKSSLGVPFLVVSDRSLLEGLEAPEPAEWRELLELSRDIVKLWDSSKSAVVLADFEGEFTGLEGELVSACFQRTLALDPRGLRPLPGGGVCRDVGLLVDLRCEEGVALVKRIMESEVISKVIWGADGDVKSLLYTPVSKPMGIHSARVVDAQLAFSNPGRRLAMSKILRKVPEEKLAGMPEKGCIDFTASHAFNRRALPLPFDASAAAYALDDLHRLDAVLLSQKPSGGTYQQASNQTSALLAMLLHKPSGGSLERLRQYAGMMRSGGGNRGRQEVLRRAVSIKRHVIALRRLEPDSICSEMSSMEAEADAILAEDGVSIPEDLSFYAHVKREEPSPPEAGGKDGADASGAEEGQAAEQGPTGQTSGEAAPGQVAAPKSGEDAPEPLPAEAAEAVDGQPKPAPGGKRRRKRPARAAGDLARAEDTADPGDGCKDGGGEEAATEPAGESAAGRAAKRRKKRASTGSAAAA